VKRRDEGGIEKKQTKKMGGRGRRRESERERERKSESSAAAQRASVDASKHSLLGSVPPSGRVVAD
jgi:hypothetical protein